MNEQLHPLTLGEILDRTAHLYRSRFLVCFGIGVIPAGTVLVFAAAIFAFLAWLSSDTGGLSATLKGVGPWLPGFTIPIGILLMLIPGVNNPQYAQMLATILMFTWCGLWFAVQALTKLVYGIALTLLYYDQRIRKEGFDIEWMMQQASMVRDLNTTGERVVRLPLTDPPKPASLESREPPFPGVPQT
jgi:hypothetical protein